MIVNWYAFAHSLTALSAILAAAIHNLCLWLLQVHANVCVASVVVTQTLDWKLHAFDVLSEFDGSNEASAGPMLVSLFTIVNQYFIGCCFLFVSLISWVLLAWPLELTYDFSLVSFNSA